jgi:hypothetical protein
VETSVISYLTARPSRDLIVAARQQITRDWWEEGREQRFVPYISDLVMREASQGDEAAAQRRIAACRGLPIVNITPEASELAQRLIATGCVPRTEPEDALHIALACTHRFEYLVTWNFAHFVSAVAKDRLLTQLRALGLKPALLATPEELWESEL